MLSVHRNEMFAGPGLHHDGYVEPSDVILFGMYDRECVYESERGERGRACGHELSVGARSASEHLAAPVRERDRGPGGGLRPGRHAVGLLPMGRVQVRAASRVRPAPLVLLHPKLSVIAQRHRLSTRDRSRLRRGRNVLRKRRPMSRGQLRAERPRLRSPQRGPQLCRR